MFNHAKPFKIRQKGHRIDLLDKGGSDRRHHSVRLHVKDFKQTSAFRLQQVKTSSWVFWVQRSQLLSCMSFPTLSLSLMKLLCSIHTVPCLLSETYWGLPNQTGSTGSSQMLKTWSVPSYMCLAEGLYTLSPSFLSYCVHDVAN